MTFCLQCEGNTMNRERAKELLPIITAFANGEDVQSATAAECRGPKQWVQTPSPCWDDECEYRIKPKTMRYRVALMKSNTNTWLGLDSTPNGVTQHSSYFQRWLTDWIEVEVE